MNGIVADRQGSIIVKYHFDTSVAHHFCTVCMYPLYLSASHVVYWLYLL
jgi:hypothetical protein